MSNDERLNEALLALCELKGKKGSAAFFGLYKRALLSELTLNEAIKAVEIAFTRKTFGFPQPADLIEFIKGNGEEEALTAWETLEQAIRSKGAYCSVLFTNPKISRVVVAMGGWIECCKWRVEDLQYRRAEFIKFYKAAGSAEQQVLPGIYEIENMARGFLDQIPEPEVIGDGLVRLALPQTKRQEFLEHCINTALAGGLVPIGQAEGGRDVEET